MSITNPEIFWKGDSSRLELQTGLSVKTSRDVVWVCTSDETSSEGVVLAFAANSSTPNMGDPLPGNGSSILKTMQADRADGTTDAWYVRLTYAPRDEEKQEKEDANGNLTTNPIDWRSEIDVSSAQMSSPVERAIYRGGFVGVAGALKAIGDEFMPCNSAFVPFDPGLEKDVALRVIRVTQFRASYNGQQIGARVNKVNSDNVVINRPVYSYQDTWAPRTARIVSAGGQFTVANGVSFWRITHEVHIKDDGWRDEVVDRGLSARALPGDPDGEGGTFSMTGRVDGQPWNRPLLDFQFVPITEPVLLNGDGQPLQPGLPPVFITYQKYQEVPFAPFNII